MKLGAAVIAAAIASGWAGPTAAQLAPGAPPAASSSDRVAVVAAPGDRFGRRLVAELTALGFTVVPADAVDATSPREGLELAARRADAVAAIRVFSSEHGIEIWIADRATGKTVIRELQADPAGDGELAVRAVDLLRASLLERSLPPPPRAEIVPTPELAARLELPSPNAAAPPTFEASRPRSTPRPATLRFAIAPTLLVSGGGFGPSLSLDLGASWMPSTHLGLAGFVTVPLSRPTVSRNGSSADLQAILAGSALRFAFARPGSGRPTGDIGVAFVSLRSVGDAAPGLAGRVASGASAAPFVGGGVAFDATPTFRLRADLRIAVMTRPLEIVFAGQKAASWGAPLFMPAVGGDFGWF